MNAEVVKLKLGSKDLMVLRWQFSDTHTYYASTLGDGALVDKKLLFM